MGAARTSTVVAGRMHGMPILFVHTADWAAFLATVV